MDEFSRHLGEWIGNLRRGGQLRAWSVLVTIFGDVIQPRGGVASAAALQQIAVLLDIEPGATRTALSRLARDGWVTRKRSGRASLVELAPDAARTSEAAARRIYATVQAAGENRGRIAILPVNGNGRQGGYVNNMAEAGFTQLGPGVFMSMGEAATTLPEEALVGELGPGEIPDWVRTRLGLDAAATGYRNLRAVADRLAGSLGRADPAPASALAARIVLIHEWRRLVLRHSEIPRDFLPADWPEQGCRVAVADLYKRLSGPAEIWLDLQNGLGSLLPDALLDRFR